jgi:CheY-like chemotaxis protein
MASATSSPRPVVPAAAESRATTTAASPPRVLIADPDELIFGRLCAALHAAGYGADAVASARELLDLTRRGVPIQLIVLSNGLPDMPTPQVLARLRETCASPPVVLVAEHGADPRRDPAGASVAACLFKPVDPAHFVGICRRILGFHEQKALRERRAEKRRGVRLPVTVEAPGVNVEAVLVSLSAGGFGVELPRRVDGLETVRVTLLRDARSSLTFDGRVQWQRALTSSGVLAGGALTRVDPEDERILTALLA